MDRAWDRRLARRAAAIAAVASIVAMLVIASTDEGGPWAARLGVWAALTPIAGAIGAAGAKRAARARGELLALEGLGVSPLRVVAGAVTGGIAVGLAGPCIAASGVADLAGLFPRPLAPRVWAAEGIEAVRELTQGVRLAAGGALSTVEATAAPISAFPRGAVVAALALAAVSAPLWIAASGSATRRAIVGGAAIAGMIVAFQAVAAGRSSALLLVLPPLLPLVDLAVRAGRAERRLA